MYGDVQPEVGLIELRLEQRAVSAIRARREHYKAGREDGQPADVCFKSHEKPPFGKSRSARTYNTTTKLATSESLYATTDLD